MTGPTGDDHLARTAGVDVTALLDRLDRRAGVTVCVPVHNGGRAVERCLTSVLRHSPGTRVVVLDDASTDPAVVRLLDEHAAAGRVELVRHAVNLGYTRTANEALVLGGRDDVVLLNSDTEVGPLWLQRLTWVAYGQDRVGTVSAVSDNAGAMALPVPGVANTWAPHLPWAEVARWCAQRTTTWSVPVPTGHGFCLYVRRDLVDAVGSFDVDAFPRGYGEENDFCLRGAAAGWANLLAPHVMVKHQRSASFGDEARTRLVAEAREVVDARHPTFTAAVRTWRQSPAMERVRREAEASVAALGDRTAVRPRRLYVLHRAGGGTPATNLDLVTELADRQDSFLLDSDGRTLELFRVDGGRPVSLRRWTPARAFHVTDTWRDDYAEEVARVVVGLGVELVHVRHLLNHPLTTLAEVVRRLGVPLVLSTHDHYLACPSIHLLDGQDRFCGGVCTAGPGRCRTPSSFVAPLDDLKGRWVHEWRDRVRPLLAAADALVATTESAAQVLRGVYGRDATAHLRVVEHGRDQVSTRPAVRRDGGRRPGPLRVLAPANWDPHKGTAYLRELMGRTGDAVEWHVAGARGEQLGDLAVVHGTYTRDGLARLVDEVDPDLFGLFPIWAETYSHTLTEAWSAGCPVVATDIGAVADRVRQHGGGVLVPLDDVAAAAALLVGLAADPGSAQESVGRPTGSGSRSLLTMANDYAALYRDVSEGLPPGRAGGVVVHGRTGEHPASAHVRVVRRLEQDGHEDVRWQRVDVADLLSGQDRTDYDVVLVQRDALPAALAEDLTTHLRVRGTRLAVELDDDLLTPPARDRLTAAGYDPERLDALDHLVGRADTVVVSTDALADRSAHVPGRVVVVPNELDPRLWARPVLPDPRAFPPAPEGEVRVLYMGTRTHVHDLALLRPVVEELRASGVAGGRLVLEVVGVAGRLDDESWFRRVDVPAGRSAYHDFVPWLRSGADRWSAAVAPLVDEPLNAAKSDLKLLEYALLGLPVVASDTGPYATAEHLAHVVGQDVRAWVAALRRAVSTPAGAEGAAAARSYVQTHRTMTRRSSARWSSVLLGEARRRPTPPPMPPPTPAQAPVRRAVVHLPLQRSVAAPRPTGCGSCPSTARPSAPAG